MERRGRDAPDGGLCGGPTGSQEPSSRKRQRLPREPAATCGGRRGRGLPCREEQSKAPRGVRCTAACMALFPGRTGSGSGDAEQDRRPRGTQWAQLLATEPRGRGQQTTVQGARALLGRPMGTSPGFRGASKECYFQERPRGHSEVWRTALLTVATRDRTCTHQTPKACVAEVPGDSVGQDPRRFRTH